MLKSLYNNSKAEALTQLNIYLHITFTSIYSQEASLSQQLQTNLNGKWKCKQIYDWHSCEIIPQRGMEYLTTGQIKKVYICFIFCLSVFFSGTNKIQTIIGNNSQSLHVIFMVSHSVISRFHDLKLYE